MNFGDFVNMVVWFLIIGSVLAVAVGLLLLLAPSRLSMITTITDRWISSRQVIRPMESMIDSDQYSLKHPRIFGGVILLAAVIILIKVSLLLAKTSVAHGGQLLATIFNAQDTQHPGWEILWSTMMTIIVLGAVLALFVGLAALFKKAWLMRVSARANDWVSGRKPSKPLDIMRSGLDDYIRARPRLWGGIIVVSGTFVIATLIWFLTLPAISF
ncbi:MAG TPA: hypothetical protein ENG78_00970 [Acidiferrobacteraceae bacterium]|nr:hypothetical protein [Acidiferrobacteraceae bacterium]HEX19389.1 hypothetical protein [Acidiferrobacteraceae bacterium]